MNAAVAATAATAAPSEMLLGEGVILLGFATLFVILFRRLGLGAVLGYLVAGALVGPQGLALVGGGETKLDIAEIGIVLLMFLVGLELNPARLWRLKRDIFVFWYWQRSSISALAFPWVRRLRWAFRSLCPRRPRCCRASRTADA